MMTRCGVSRDVEPLKVVEQYFDIDNERVSAPAIARRRKAAHRRTARICNGTRGARSTIGIATLRRPLCVLQKHAAQPVRSHAEHNIFFCICHIPIAAEILAIEIVHCILAVAIIIEFLCTQCNIGF